MDPEEVVGCVDEPVLPRRVVIRIQRSQDITKGDTWPSTNSYTLITNLLENILRRREAKKERTDIQIYCPQLHQPNREIKIHKLPLQSKNNEK